MNLNWLNELPISPRNITVHILFTKQRHGVTVFHRKNTLLVPMYDPTVNCREKTIYKQFESLLNISAKLKHAYVFINTDDNLIGMYMTTKTLLKYQ